MTQAQVSSKVSRYSAYVQAANFRDPEDGMFPFEYWLMQAYAFGDIVASKINVQLPANCRVLEVLHEIDATLTGITAIEIGDGDDADGWIDDAWVAGLIGEFIKTPYDAEYANGRWYRTADTIDVTFSGIATAGAGIVGVKILSYVEAAEAG